LSGYPLDWADLREMALRRDGYHCGNCGGNVGLNVHHVVPLGYGGSNRLDNLRTLCWECHQRSHGKFGRVNGPRNRRSSKSYELSGPAMLFMMLSLIIGLVWLFSLPFGQMSITDVFLVVLGVPLGSWVVEWIYRSSRSGKSSQPSVAPSIQSTPRYAPPRTSTTYSFSVAIPPVKQDESHP
jgi:hypothetical protein